MQSVARVLMAVAVTFACGIARADDADVSRALPNLRHEDFRVRTQAALALGASKSQRAIGPLCQALGDDNLSVRAAAAAALGRLSLGGDDCLEKRLSNEDNKTVKAAIEKALEQFDGGEPVFTPDVRYYVAVGKLTDKSGRSGNALERLVRKSVASSGSGIPSFALAPGHETPARAKERIAKRPKVKAFFLSPRLPPFEYSDGNLTVRLEVAMFSYPEKAMLGAFSVRLTQPDVASQDTGSENELVSLAAERALEKFSRIAPTL
ncbi:MAG: HEAT repeat domain-containing protein [Polyangiaceae bacterium]